MPPPRSEPGHGGCEGQEEVRGQQGPHQGEGEAAEAGRGDGGRGIVAAEVNQEVVSANKAEIEKADGETLVDDLPEQRDGHPRELVNLQRQHAKEAEKNCPDPGRREPKCGKPITRSPCDPA